MPKNYLLIYSEQLATEIELLCKNIKAPSNTLFQIRKSSSSVREANYGQSKADMLSKFEIALKECSETEGWLRLLFNTNAIDGGIADSSKINFILVTFEGVDFESAVVMIADFLNENLEGTK